MPSKPTEVSGCRVGDVISLGKHWSVPDELVGKFFRITGLKDGNIQLSWPCDDEAMTKRHVSQALKQAKRRGR